MEGKMQQKWDKEKLYAGANIVKLQRGTSGEGRIFDARRRQNQVEEFSSRRKKTRAYNYI